MRRLATYGAPSIYTVQGNLSRRKQAYLSSIPIGNVRGRLVGYIVLLPRYGISLNLATKFIVDGPFRSVLRFCDNHRQHYATKDLRSPQNLFPLTKLKVAPARLRGGPTTRLTCSLRSMSRSDGI